MAKILEMPKLSPTMEEGRIAAWHKKVGDAVGVDDLLAEVETDKATMEFRSFDKGTLLDILAPAGSNVVLGQPVAILGAAGEDVSALKGNAAAPAAAPGAPVAAVATTPVASPAPANANANVSPPADAPAPVVNDGRVKASPLVRKLAREQGFDLRTIVGSGPHGRIVARDLEGQPAPAPARLAPAPLVPPASRESEAKPLSMMRKTIARRLTESKQTVPHFYLTVDLDADALVALRERLNADLAALPDAGGAQKVSINDLLIKACAIALVRVPACNATFTPEAILYHRRVDISVAVAVDDGLVTPVVRDADRKGVLAVSAEVRELAGRAKQKKLKPEEMAGGTFSISNLGMFGIDAFAAVINPPEGAILAVGQVRKEPVVRGDAIVVGHKLACTLSCDHRVVDGAVGATFLKELRALVEHPTRILL
jgi:pyruvate dehydrogenase E2 component (dihydrolipoamide acetyltransferase)